MNYKILNNGNKIPYIGFGTWKFSDGEASEAVKIAINNGYRHIDTASSYGNEIGVGKGIKNSNIPRSELFVTGKLWNSDRGYDKTISALKRTLRNLQLDYLDLYLIHWPASPAVHNNWQEINNDTWRAMEYLYTNGLVKAIGVCNFQINHLQSLLECATVVPMVNQIEIHPGLPQKEIINYCLSKSIIVEAWSPLGSGKMLKKDILKKYADKYGKSVAQICLKWCIQSQVIPLPKAEDADKMHENLNLEDFVIFDEDMVEITNLPYMGGSGLDSNEITIFD